MWEFTRECRFQFDFDLPQSAYGGVWDTMDEDVAFLEAKDKWQRSMSLPVMTITANHSLISDVVAYQGPRGAELYRKLARMPHHLGPKFAVPPPHHAPSPVPQSVSGSSPPVSSGPASPQGSGVGSSQGLSGHPPGGSQRPFAGLGVGPPQRSRMFFNTSQGPTSGPAPGPSGLQPASQSGQPSGASNPPSPETVTINTLASDLRAASLDVKDMGDIMTNFASRFASSLHTIVEQDTQQGLDHQMGLAYDLTNRAARAADAYTHRSHRASVRNLLNKNIPDVARDLETDHNTWTSRLQRGPTFTVPNPNRRD